MRLVRERGIATAAAAAEHPGAMAAMIGLDDAVVEELCDGIEGVWPANYNCPGQLVVSGTVDGVVALMAAAEAAGARRAIRLKVSGGFHSPLTASPSRSSRQRSPRSVPRARDAVLLDRQLPGSSRPARDPAAARAAADGARPLHPGVERLRDLGVGTFVEIGPGSVLSGLVRRIDRSLSAMSISDPEGLDRVLPSVRMPELDGRVALVTGASRGIGRAIAIELAAAGAAVGVNYRADADAAAEVVAAIEAGGRPRGALQADVSDADAARELVGTCEEALGDLDVLVCNAGVTRDGLIARLSPEDWTTVIDTNLAGSFFLCQAASRRMIRRRRARSC